MKKSLHVFSWSTAKDYRTMTSRWRGTPYCQEIPPGAVLEIGDFVEKRWGGYLWTVEHQGVCSVVGKTRQLIFLVVIDC